MDGFLNVWGEFPYDMLGTLAKGLVALWNGKIFSSVTIYSCPRFYLSRVGVQNVLSFTAVLGILKCLGQRLEHHGKTIRDSLTEHNMPSVGMGSSLIMYANAALN